MSHDMLFGEVWWRAEEDEELWNRVVAAARDVDERTLDGRQQRMLENYCLYGDRSVLESGYGRMDRPDGIDRISRNVIANATDAVLSEVTQTRPRPMFVTIGGGWGEQQRARKLTYYCDAKFQACEARDLMEQATRDAIISGIGILRPYIDPAYKEVRIERILPLHFLFDDSGCTSVMPRSFYVRHIIDRWHLMEVYPEHAETIRTAQGLDASTWYYGVHKQDDVVEVYEAIHLPSRPTEDGEETDGRHCLVISGAVLMDMPYEHQDPPFAFVRAVKPIKGFLGESLVERAASTQTELNKLLARIQDAMHLHARPIWWVPRQGKVVKAHITNKVGAIVEYDGPTPPTQSLAPSMPPDVYAYVGELKQEIYGLMGVSELSARSLKPVGLNAAVAINAYNDVQSRRMISLERDFESLSVKLARLIVRLERQLAEEDPSHEVVYEKRRGKTREVIPWTEIDLDEDSFRIQVFPASAFPTDPAAKIQMLENMLQRGSIDQLTFYELALDVPDLEAVRNRVVAPQELLLERFELMMDSDPDDPDAYWPPDGYTDLKLGLKLCAPILQRAELDRVPEGNCDLLRQWMGDAEELLNPKPASAAALMGAPMPGPEAMLPMAPDPMMPMAPDPMMPMQPDVMMPGAGMPGPVPAMPGPMPMNQMAV